MTEPVRPTELSTSKPRRVQFGLRALLVLVAVVAIGFGVAYRRSPITAETIANLRQVGNLDKDVYQIDWSPDRRRVALVSWEKPVEIRDLTTLALLDAVAAKEKVIHFAFSPDPSRVAYCENNKIAVIFDLKAGRRIELETRNSQPDMVFSPDGSLLATGGYGTDAKLWRASDGQLLRSLGVAVEGGLRPEFTPNSRRVAIGNRNGQTSVFDVATGELLYRLPKQSSQELRFSPSGDRLAVTYVDGSIAVWSADDGSRLAEQRTNAEELYTVDWSPDGTLLATAGLNAPVTIWDAHNLTIVREMPAPEWVIGVRFSPDGMSLYTAGGSLVPGGKRSLQVWGVEGPLYSLINRPQE